MSIPKVTRRSFVHAAALLAAPPLAPVMASQPGAGPGAPESSAFPGQEPALVQDMVIAAHGNVDKVKALVGRQQTLAKATWDWGFGDWETALGGASHVGRPDIAEYLIANGAAPTIFSAAMLGQLDVVKAHVASAPGIQRQKGPHSITLMRHAMAGGPRAVAVVEYLKTLGDADVRPAEQTLSPEDIAKLTGDYRAPARATAITITVDKQGRLTFAHGGRSRGLNHLGAYEFYPAGADNVRVRFADAAAGVTVTVHDPDVVLTAIKAR